MVPPQSSRLVSLKREVTVDPSKSYDSHENPTVPKRPAIQSFLDGPLICNASLVLTQTPLRRASIQLQIVSSSLDHPCPTFPHSESTEQVVVVQLKDPSELLY